MKIKKNRSFRFKEKITNGKKWRCWYRRVGLGRSFILGGRGWVASSQISCAAGRSGTTWADLAVFGNKLNPGLRLHSASRKLYFTNTYLLISDPVPCYLRDHLECFRMWVFLNFFVLVIADSRCARHTPERKHWRGCPGGNTGTIMGLPNYAI